MKRCASCAAEMRPRNTRKEDHPGTKAEAARGLCVACYERQYRPRRLTPRRTPKVERPEVIVPDEPSVLVRTDLRPSTYKRICEVARSRKIKPGELLSRIADAAVRGEQP